MNSSPDIADLSSVDPGWAWSEYRPSAERPWTRELAAHLHRRAGFAATWDELESSLKEGPPAAIARLLAGGPQPESFYQQVDAGLRPLIATGSVEHLPAWWLHTMLNTPHPLKEKLTLFWHGHFATSAAKVTDPHLMYRQNALLRKHALGKFGPLVREASKDPAMLLWLDAATNHKTRPNENFAREVMELFCLGVGNYSEQDIKEAARALTGWELRQGRFMFNATQHDRGEKTILGQTGNFDGDDLLDILLKQPSAARFLVGKMYRLLISEAQPPPARIIEPLAAGYQQREFDTAWLVETMLASNLFFSPHALRQRIKSPVEFAVGLLRPLHGTANMYAVAEDLRSLGQGVFYPPNVKGWDGGQEWINSASLLARANLAWGLVSSTDSRLKCRVPLEELARQAAAADGSRLSQWLVDLLISGPVPEAVRVQMASLAADSSGGAHARLARLVHAITTLPEYQLS